jgi:hypothetical protein
MSWTDGAVPNVIWLRIYSRGIIPVGAVRRDNHVHWLGCPLILADEPALGRREGSRIAIALASLSAMLAFAHRAVIRSRPRTCQTNHQVTRLDVRDPSAGLRK